MLNVLLGGALVWALTSDALLGVGASVAVSVAVAAATYVA